jgi:predicted GIY-YIG superfamily endonuclease
VEETYCVYIMSNVSRMLYTGVINDLEARVFEHKSKRIPGYTQRYNLFKLIYFEAFGGYPGCHSTGETAQGMVALQESVTH